MKTSIMLAVFVTAAMAVDIPVGRVPIPGCLKDGA
ncbi:hypothetical protein Ptr902_06456 [Pyrenophora tritici-repentis]|uniref:Uncharacterized protein n=1 Tax=Pyrenophora tritici-repentis TaxID=45151 RepID=A0A5M9LLI1_9PLEO|nr:hypothetical protein PtrV1_00438 [Pyrenophora tritici-repentis]KAF7453153.1 hypothetical protein A1F99_004110 [Pyrenophora tritici-repentis]KAF7576215.1 hypothetical protein PtrM4_004550 [Pyrenophora tritici-repentis]KAI0582337.1 hypothetical protein Alg215_04168 [Pyrenophora tritici-repentis]KAI0591425.1 hypothetical protein Alg130_01249 [Pyrenophora tritici-repentis]